MVLRRFLFIILLLLPVATLAQSLRVRVQHVTESSHGTRIQGIWPTSCQVTVRSRSREASGRVNVLLADNASHCLPGQHPFSIELSDQEQFSPATIVGEVTPVHVFAEQSDDPPAQVGFALLGGQTRHLGPDSGFWWPQGENDGSGNVLSLELQGDTLGIALLTHDDLSGAPVWYFGTSRLTGHVAHASLTRLDGGSSPFFGIHVQPTPHPGWTIDLAFDTSTRAQIWLSRPSPVRAGELEVTSMQFARRSFSKETENHQWRGTWLVARDVAVDDSDTNATWPSRLDFTADQTLDKWHTRLIGSNGDFALDCRVADQNTASAQNCTLRDATGQPLARFDQVGLDRLDGQDMQGHTVVLLRPR